MSLARMCVPCPVVPVLLACKGECWQPGKAGAGIDVGRFEIRHEPGIVVRLFVEGKRFAGVLLHGFAAHIEWRLVRGRFLLANQAFALAPVGEAALGFLGSGKVGEARTNAFEPPIGTCSSTLPAVRLSDAWFGGVTARRGDLPLHPWRPFPRMFASARVVHRIQRVSAPKRPAHPRPVWRERSSARRYP